MKSAMLSALERWSIAVICRLLMLCPGGRGITEKSTGLLWDRACA